MSQALAAGRRRSTAGIARDYLSLLKLRVVLLLDATAVGAMVAAAHGLPRPATVLAVVAGGALAGGGAHAINAWFDRDIDAVMRRTRTRPVPAGRIPGWHALLLGIALNAAAFTLLGVMANLVAALLTLAGTLIYVFVYTIWLKRSTPQNIVIGGAAGAVPPLVGWAAVTGGLDATAISLFLLIFFWTPVHFWALARMLEVDYETAGVPMMPVVAGDESTKRQSLGYALVTVLVSLVPFATGAAGRAYLAGAVALGLGFLAVAVMDLRRRGWTGRLFGYSNAYLGAVFCLLALVSVTV